MKRVQFPPGKQRAFLLEIVGSKKPTEIARDLQVHPRSFSDWIRERHTLPFPVYESILKKYKQSGHHEAKVLDQYWFVQEAGRKGAIAHIKKYGRVNADEEKRKRRWFEWWNTAGKHNLHSICSAKSITKPLKDEKLAEFIGIMIGDGSVAKRQISVTLNAKDDADYIVFVSSLIEKLFGATPTTLGRSDSLAATILVSRSELVTFCVDLGLKQGNKLNGGLDIPTWIQEDIHLAKACIRGIMDTDGCIFQETHCINGKAYSYPRISIVSASENLLVTMHKILQKCGFMSKIRHRRVNLESYEDIARYFKEIGSSNSKHIKRFENFTRGRRRIVV